MYSLKSLITRGLPHKYKQNVPSAWWLMVQAGGLVTCDNFNLQGIKIQAEEIIIINPQ